MKFSKIIAAATVATTTLLPLAAQAQQLEYWAEAAGWDVMVDPSLGHGCLIQAEYDEGTVVRIGFDLTEGAGYLTAFNYNWGEIEQGAHYDVTFDLDGQEYDGVATGIYLGDVPGADIYFTNPDFLWDLAAKFTLTLYHDGGEVMAIDLGGTMVALEEAMVCQDSQ